MILVLDDKSKADLSFVKEQAADVVLEFARISLEFIRKGANAKLYAGAAKALGVTVEQVEASVEGLAHLFSEASRFLVTEPDFTATLVTLGFDADIAEKLRQIYVDNKADVRHIQKQLFLDLPHYVDLDWRLDVVLASRCLRHQMEPLFMLKLKTELGGVESSQVLQTDYANLKHLSDQLELALKEMKTAHVRRIMRNV